MEETTRELVDILITQNTHFKDMMQFGINAILAILVIFLGAHFFTMRSFKKEELSRVKADIEIATRNEFLPSLKEELKENVKQEIQSQIESLTSQVNLLEQELNSFKIDIESNRKYSLSNFKEISSKIYILQGDLWSSKGVYANAFDDYIRAGMIYIELKKSSMEGILNKIEETIEKKDEINTWEKSDLQKFLNGLSSEYNTTKETIEQKVKAK